MTAKDKVDLLGAAQSICLGAAFLLPLLGKKEDVVTLLLLFTVLAVVHSALGLRIFKHTLEVGANLHED